MSSTNNANVTNNDNIIVVDADEQETEFPKRLVKYFSVIEGILEDISETDEESAPIPTPQVPRDLMLDILDFATQPCFDAYTKYYDHPENWYNNELRFNSKEWNTLLDQGVTYICGKYDENRKRLLELILASNYLECAFISKACARYCAEIIKGKNTEEIHEAFNMPPNNGPYDPKHIRDAIKSAKSRGIDIDETKYLKKDVDAPDVPDVPDVPDAI